MLRPTHWQSTGSPVSYSALPLPAPDSNLLTVDENVVLELVLQGLPEKDARAALLHCDGELS